MGILRKTINKLIGVKRIDVQGDAISYNSKDNINRLHKSFEYFKSTLLNSQNFIKAVYDFIKTKDINLSKISIVDIGCGPGILLNMINRDYPESLLKGMDFSETKIANCSKVYPLINFESHNIYKPHEGVFDLVICTEVLEHLEFPEKAIANLLKMMTVNGTLLITVPNGRIDNFAGHIFYWSPESWKLFIDSNTANLLHKETGTFNNGKNNYAIIKNH